MADANTMIRCIIGDSEQKIQELEEIRSIQKIIYTIEVIAEVVYVLVKVYGIPREETSQAITRFLKSRNIMCKNEEVVIRALQLFAENHLDFVDDVLLAYHQVTGISIYSYDRKLNNAIKRGSGE